MTKTYLIRVDGYLKDKAINACRMLKTSLAKELTEVCTKHMEKLVKKDEQRTN